MNIVVCDDNTDVLKNVEKLINEFEIEFDKDFNAYYFDSPISLLNSNCYYSIAILDVEMPDMDGIELAKRMREKNNQLVLIFLTAYSQYIDNAFDLNAARFFEKPINKQRFFNGLNNAIEKIDTSQINIFLKDNNCKVKLLANEIMFIEVDGRGTKIITKVKDYKSTQTIDYFKNRLVNKSFVSPHKSFLVNMNYISSYERTEIIIDRRYRVPISRNNQSNFRKAFISFVGDK